jgi:hypothetical protein
MSDEPKKFTVGIIRLEGILRELKSIKKHVFRRRRWKI